MNRKEYNDLAKSIFGERVSVHGLDHKLVNDFIAAHREGGNIDPVTEDECAEYGEYPWVVDGKCAICGRPLQGYFAWGIRHGCGTCQYCKGASYRYYHRVRDTGYPYMAFALSGWTDDSVQEYGLDPHLEVAHGA